MLSFTKFSTRAKLYIGFGIIILAIVVNNILSYQSLTVIHESEGNLVKLMGIARNLTQLRSDENRLNGLTLEIIINKDLKDRALTIEELKDGVKSVEARTSEINKSLELFPSEMRMFQEVTTNIASLRRNRQ